MKDNPTQKSKFEPNSNRDLINRFNLELSCITLKLVGVNVELPTHITWQPPDLIAELENLPSCNGTSSPHQV